MNKQTTLPDAAAPSADPPSGTDDDGGSPAQEPHQHSAEPNGRSFFSRLVRLFRPSKAGSLRQDIADALLVDTGSDTAFSPEERAMLHNILRLREIRVEDVMVPRADIEAVDENATIGELMIFFEESGRSRMPVYSESLDDPRGMVHIRDVLAYVTKQSRSKRRSRNGASRNGQARNGGRAGETSKNGPSQDSMAERTNGREAATELARRKNPFDFSRVDFSKTVREAGIVRKVLFVPPSMLAADLMQRMQANRTQMALVIDEYGGTDGLASLEDIVEMVVGDIEDEHDDDEVMVNKVSDDVYMADAKAELEDIAELIGSDFDIRDQIEDVDTLGGLLFAALGRVPARGEVVQALPGFEFHVLDADPRRIKRVRIVRRRMVARRRPPKSEPDTQVPRPPADEAERTNSEDTPASA